MENAHHLGLIMEKEETKTKPASTKKQKNNSLFACEDCGFTFKKEMQLKKHLRKGCDNHRMFQCPYCPKRTARKDNHKRHIVLKHEIVITIAEVSDKEVAISTAAPKEVDVEPADPPASVWRKTVMAAAAQNKQEYLCAQCGKSFQTLTYLQTHTKRTYDVDCIAGTKRGDSQMVMPDGNQESNQDCVCPDCGKQYKYRRGLWAHRKYECNKEPQFGCPVCFRRFSRKTHWLEALMRQECLEVTPRYMCPNCPRSYKHRITLNRHLREECGISSRYACPFCTFKAKRKDKIMSHLKVVHQTESKFKCEDCGRTYVQASSLRRHLKFECGAQAQFVCQICLSRFRRHDTLTRHIIVKHRPNLCFVYQTSDWKQSRYLTDSWQALELARSIVLVEHDDSSRNGTEAGDSSGTYRCDDCGKVYTHQKSLIRHSKFECGKTPQHRCPHCNYVTKYGFSLKKHVFLKHNSQCSLKELIPDA
ncbi:hypothetical protein LSTR_LSTR000986 [Laodelphax striatellus]|uniref:C2H2-type domain-containing protein n=1 Tax=Laodelphax striatellus TaxID=195883 RepID=A0A482X0V3_LAOST|nr:hypothetical protein LSTR_LSTR000986 [Laodelphax striatellus]